MMHFLHVSTTVPRGGTEAKSDTSNCILSMVLSDQFLPCDAMLVWYTLSSCIRPSVCPSQVGVPWRWLNLGSCKQLHTIAKWCQRCRPKSNGVTTNGDTK